MLIAGVALLIRAAQTVGMGDFPLLAEDKIWICGDVS
jgi:hypothetical protein